MLAKARQILVSELALAEKTNEDKAEGLLDEVLATQRLGYLEGYLRPFARGSDRRTSADRARASLHLVGFCVGG